jgi:hypothetical protein
MQINMTPELQAALNERLQRTLATMIGENLLMTIVVESLEQELNTLRVDHENMAQANRRLMEDCSKLREALSQQSRATNKSKTATTS